MKKFLSVFLVVALALGMSACKKENKTPETPVYESNEKFEIGMWVGISDKLVEYDSEGKKLGSRNLTDEEFLEKYQEIADAGFTVAFPGYDVMIEGGAYNLKALKAAHTVGIKHILGDNNLRQTLISAKGLVDSGVKTEEQIVGEVRNILKPYLESEYASALKGFMVRDEPGANLFDDLSYGLKIFKQVAPDLMYYVNLFPVIAGGAQLSGGGTAINYDTYITQFMGKMDTGYISYDHYPLYSDTINTSLEASFLYNMDVLKTKIEEEDEDREFWTFLQSIQFGARNRALESKADATFQAYSFLAYGGDGIQWFCYACPPPNDGATNFGNNALVDRDYNKTATYGYVQGANKAIQSLMPYYKNFENWKGIMISDNTYDDSGNFEYLDASDNVLTSTKSASGLSATEDAFAGVFEDKDGNEGFMVVNFTDPALNKENVVTIKIKDGYSHVLVVNEGVETVVEVKDGKIDLTMAPGGGLFVIPFGNK